MDPAIPRALLWGSLFALPTAVLTQYHLPTAAALAAAGCLLAIFGRARWRWSGLCALPVLLAALHPPVPPRVWPRPGPVVVQGTVTDQSRMPATGETLVLLGSGPNGLRLHCTGPLDLLFGDRIRVTAHLSPTVAPGLLPTLRAPAAAIHKVEGPASAPRLAMAARSALERQLLRLVPGENGALLATLALGRGTRTSADLTQAHRATGLSHLLAVSGAHAVMLGWLLGLGGRRRSQLAAGRLRTGLALAVLFAYALITGSEPPVLRAILAFGLGALATTLGRPLSLASGLLPPALLTAMMSPEALVGPSFLLSYAAVIGLSLASTHGTSRAERYLWSPLRASFWATLATAPITLFWFGQLAPWTVLLTPLLAPLVGVLLLGSLLAAALGCLIPGANAPFGPVLDHLASLYTGVVRTADLLPGTPIQAPFVPPTWALVLTGAMALGVIERLRNRRGIAIALVLASLPHFVPLSPPQPPRLLLFAIGHGQAALAQDHAGHQIAIDCGSLQQPLRTARKFAQALVRRSLDLLVITHADQDHHNGVRALLQLLPIDRAILPQALRGSDVEQALLEHGTHLEWLAPGQRCEPFANLAVGAPDLPAHAADNDQSLWVRARLGPLHALLTGDAEEVGTAAAIAQGLAAPCDLLVLPHHGRPNAQGPALLRAVRPTVCFASADTGDGETALGRLARGFGCDPWITGQHGDLELLAGAQPAVRTSLGPRPMLRRP